MLFRVRGFVFASTQGAAGLGPGLEELKERVTPSEVGRYTVGRGFGV